MTSAGRHPGSGSDPPTGSDRSRGSLQDESTRGSVLVHGRQV